MSIGTWKTVLQEEVTEKNELKLTFSLVVDCDG
jgi:hypothetical protein